VFSKTFVITDRPERDILPHKAEELTRTF